MTRVQEEVPLKCLITTMAVGQFIGLHAPSVDSLCDGAHGAARAGAAGTLSGAGGAGWTVTLGAGCPWPLVPLTHTAGSRSHWHTYTESHIRETFKSVTTLTSAGEER